MKIDVDGVLRDIYPMIISCYDKEMGYESKIKPSDIKSYILSKHFPRMGNKEAFFIRNAKSIFLEAKPFKDYDKINEISRNHNILIVTDQLNGLETLTLEWLNLWGIKYKDIFFTGDKEVVPGDILLDDNPRNILNTLDTSMKVIMDRPYNQDIRGIRVRNMEDFSRTIYGFS